MAWAKASALAQVLISTFEVGADACQPGVQVGQTQVMLSCPVAPERGNLTSCTHLQLVVTTKPAAILPLSSIDKVVENVAVAAIHRSGADEPVASST